MAVQKQVIGHGERTMNEIVEAYVNPDLPPEEWDTAQLVAKVKEFAYLEDLTPDQVQGLGMDELAFRRNSCAMPTTSRRVRWNSASWFDAGSRAFFILQQIDTSGANTFRPWMPSGNPSVCVVMVRRIH